MSESRYDADEIQDLKACTVTELRETLEAIEAQSLGHLKVEVIGLNYRSMRPEQLRIELDPSWAIEDGWIRFVGEVD